MSYSGVVGNALDSNIVVSEFEFQSRYYFRTHTRGKDVNSLIPQARS